MTDDIIFHLVSGKDWRTHQNSGRYEPPSLEEEDFIHCSGGQQVEEVANRLFTDCDDLMLIVVDVARLEAEVKWETPEDRSERYPHVYGPLNVDAIIDKIHLAPESDGRFQIRFTTEE